MDYGNGTFVMCGFTGKIDVLSAAGLFRARNFGPDVTLTGVAYGGGSDWSVVGFYRDPQSGEYFDVMLHSSDNGSSWSNPLVRPTGSVNTTFQDVAGRNHAYAAVRWNGKIEFSADGLNYDPNTQVPPTFALNRVTVSNSGIWVAVGRAGEIRRSSNGVIWSAPENNADRLFGVTYGGGYFVAVGPEGNVWYSSDGAGWVRSGSRPPALDLHGIAYGFASWVTVGDEGNIYQTHIPAPNLRPSQLPGWDHPIRILPTPTWAGEDVNISLGLDNAGEVNAARFSVEVLVNDTSLGTAGPYTLPAQSGPVALHLVPIRFPAGVFTITFRLDADGDTPESNEFDNEISRTFRVYRRASISGLISLQDAVNKRQNLTFTFYNLEDSGMVFTRQITLSANGSFRITDIPGGRYRMRVKGDKWLAMTINDIDLTDQNADIGTILLHTGDANYDNTVNHQDLTLLIQAFDSTPDTPRWNGDIDFNCDDSVDVLDLDLLIRNFGKSVDP